MTPTHPEFLKLYLVLDPDHCRGNVVEIARAAIDHGVTCLQLRWKTGTDREVLHLARAIQALAEPRSIPFVINDRIDIALAAGAGGVHLGVDDLPVVDARRIAGPGFVIGYSPELEHQILAAAAAGASYLGIGPVFETTTKPDAGPALGIREFTRRRGMTTLPVVAIGGITAANVIEAMAAGADGVAVASAILGAPDPAGATSVLREATHRGS